MTHLCLQTRHLPRICYGEVKSIKWERHLQGVLAFSICLSLYPEGKRVKWTCRNTLVAELQAPLISFAFWRTWEAFLFMDMSMFTVMIEWREGSLGTCIQMCCWHKEAAYSFKRVDPRNKPFFTLQLWTHTIKILWPSTWLGDWTRKWTGSERQREVSVSSQGWWYLPREPRRKICGPARLPGCLSL